MSQILPPPPATLPTRLTPMGRIGPLVEVEYLESRTDLWGGGILTGIIPDAETKIEIEFEYFVGSDQQQIFRAGSLGLAVGCKLYVSMGQLQVIYDGTQTAVYDQSDFYVRHHLVLGPFGNVPILDGIRLGFEQTPKRFVCDYGLTLFSNRQNSRLYYCRLWQSGILVRDFVPVRLGTTGYLFDKVTGGLFGNSGTGEFILGPDKIS